MVSRLEMEMEGCWQVLPMLEGVEGVRKMHLLKLMAHALINTISRGVSREAHYAAVSTNPNCFATSDKTTAYEYSEVILDDVGVGPDGVINIAPENNDLVNELKKMKL